MNVVKGTMVVESCFIFSKTHKIETCSGVVLLLGKRFLSTGYIIISGTI